MRRLLCLILIATIGSAFAQVRPAGAELAKLGASIVALIDTEKPIFLEVRAGDWGPVLTGEIEKQLLEKGAEIRQLITGDQLPASSVTDSLITAVESFDLASYALEDAMLVRVDMELQWQTLEHRSFISYSSERKPIYVFTVRQIQLPEHRLEKVGSAQFQFSGEKSGVIASTGIKWFEPMLVTATLASIIYLLWTTE
jgi:hypothetical protein